MPVWYTDFFFFKSSVDHNWQKFNWWLQILSLEKNLGVYNRTSYYFQSAE